MLKYKQFGSANGRLVIYFHGAPGAPEEAAIFDLAGKENGLSIICFDRFSVDSSVGGEAYYRLLANEILKITGEKPVDIIGFSIGAFVALQTCRHLVGKVGNLHLVSAAAPLEAGNFLHDMAGKQVFQLAKNFPFLFLLLSYWQGLLARFFPGVLFSLLFASAVGQDKILAADNKFKNDIVNVLRSCFTGRVRGYTRDVTAYVHPWKARLAEVTVATHIWHGADDNWSPRTMAAYLESALPNCAANHLFNGLSHYSCLYRAAAEIGKQLGKEGRDA